MNSNVNRSVRLKPDLQHWGVSEKWSYPDDGYGDCEDLALQKRRLLIEKGWPASALLMTVVWKGNKGHAVLLARTNDGEFVLDIERSKILLWSKTGYRFVKRQSTSDPNDWVYIDRPLEKNTVVASKRKRQQVKPARQVALLP